MCPDKSCFKRISRQTIYFGYFTDEKQYPTQTEVFVPIEQTSGAPPGKKPRPESGEIVTEAR